MIHAWQLCCKIPARVAAAIQVLNEDSSDSESEEENVGTNLELELELKENQVVVVEIWAQIAMEEACPVIARFGILWTIYFLLTNYLEETLLGDHQFLLVAILILAIYFSIPFVLFIYAFIGFVLQLF